MRLLLMGVGAAAIALGALGHVPSSPTGGVEEKVRAVAAGMAAITPKRMGDGAVLRSARADGVTLALKIDGLPDWRPTFSDAEMGRMIGATICTRAGIPKLMNEGGRIRFELTTPLGASLPPLTVDHCG